MEKIGIICEYNPFHNGHLYHIRRVKEMFPSSTIVLAMSGYFSERGDVSLISKFNKTKIALKYGVDLVLELPTLYGVNSADYFAEASIKILNMAGVNKIVFGSECNDVEMLLSAARLQLDNPEFDIKVRDQIKMGVNYPTALSRACGTNYGSNDLLGISYIKAILKNNFDIEPLTIKRTNDFNDKDLDEEIVSAENIRDRLKNGEDIEKYIPDYSKDYINKVDDAKIFELLKFKIVTSDDLGDYLGVDEGLENKLKKEIYRVQDLDTLVAHIKSKRYTYVRLKRMLVHILLGIKKDDITLPLKFAKVLGFTENGQKYLKTLSSDRLVYRCDGRIWELEMRAKEVYYELTKDESCKYEELNRPIKSSDL